MSRLVRLPMAFSLQFGDGLNSNSHPGVISCYIASLQSLSSRLVARAENEILAFLFEPSTGSVSCCIDIWSKSGGSFGQSWPVEVSRDQDTHSYEYLDICLVQGYANAMHPYPSLYLPFRLQQEPNEPRNTLLCSERILSASKLPKRLNFPRHF